LLGPLVEEAFGVVGIEGGEDVPGWLGLDLANCFGPVTAIREGGAGRRSGAESGHKCICKLGSRRIVDGTHEELFAALASSPLAKWRAELPGAGRRTEHVLGGLRARELIRSGVGIDVYDLCCIGRVAEH